MVKNISKTLIVGIGGTGQRVICDIKKRMLSTYGEIPPLVQFLAIDTDGYRNDDDPPYRYYHEGPPVENTYYRIQHNEFLVPESMKKLKCFRFLRVKSQTILLNTSFNYEITK